MLGLVFVVHNQSDQCSVIPCFGEDTAMAVGKLKSNAILAREKQCPQEWKIKTDCKYKAAISITFFLRKSSVQKILLRMLSQIVSFYQPGTETFLCWQGSI
jgi:hypothetical protein